MNSWLSVYNVCYTIQRKCDLYQQITRGQTLKWLFCSIVMHFFRLGGHSQLNLGNRYFDHSIAAESVFRENQSRQPAV